MGKMEDFERLLKAMPPADRGYSWELRDWNGRESIRASGEIATACKFMLDNTQDLIFGLSSHDSVLRRAEKAEAELYRLRKVILELAEDDGKRDGDLISGTDHVIELQAALMAALREPKQ